MQIAITSQNRKTITEHAGKCRKFWIYEVEQERVASRRLVELDLDQSFHASQELPRALAGIDVLISRGMGGRLQQRLLALGIRPLLTDLDDPERAVADFLRGQLLSRSPEAGCDAHEHAH